MTPEQMEQQIERLGMENGGDWPTEQSVRDSLTVANIVDMFGESEDGDDPTEDQGSLDEIAAYFIETRMNNSQPELKTAKCACGGTMHHSDDMENPFDSTTGDCKPFLQCEDCGEIVNENGESEAEPALAKAN